MGIKEQFQRLEERLVSVAPGGLKEWAPVMGCFYAEKNASRDRPSLVSNEEILGHPLRTGIYVVYQGFSLFGAMTLMKNGLYLSDYFYK